MNTSLKSQDGEIWRPIPGFPGYEVSNQGRVRSYWIKGNRYHHAKLSEQPRRILKPAIVHGQYYQITLVRNGERHQRRVYDLVATTFIGPRPKERIIAHKDGDTLNDRADNLKYGTWSEALKGHPGPMGERGRGAKFTDAQAKEIREEFDRGTVTLSELQAQFKVRHTTLCGLLTGRSYKSAGGPIQERLGRQLPGSIAREIRERAAKNGITLTRLAEEYDRDLAAISRIVNGITHKQAGGPIKGVDYDLGV